ncbi:MAG: ferredoxin family protein [Beijerinckiaceae bacterium]
MADEPKVRVEEKLQYNRYLVDPGKPHIAVAPHDKPSHNLQAMTTICPAGCYANNPAGQVEVVADGCMECGTCRILLEASGEITWTYPRGGYGVLFKFG